MNIYEAKKKLSRELLKYDGINGVGIKEEKGVEYLVVYLAEKSEELKKIIPHHINGIKIKIEIVGEIKAL